MPIDLLERGRELLKSFPDNSKCSVCSTSIEVQGHHMWPLHLGGPQDGPLLALCSKDHLMVHHLSGKKKEIPPGFTATQIKLIRLLVQFINIAKIQFEDMDPSVVERKMMIKVPQALLKQAHKRKQDCGFSNLEDYVLSLIVRDTSSL